MKLKSSCLILLLINSLSTSAEVTLDGTLGRGGALKGPDYLIGADLGQQHGGNLFHSFQDFNLNRSESATFSGPNSVSNIISRVTGGNPSQIDGLIRSTIPNADMYFLNPYGIMFGENAKLDVQGSFHASTADYLRLGDGGRFDARNHRSSLLTVAPIESFGFLSNSPAKITTQSSKLLVPSDKTLSLIGGDIHVTSDTPLTADNSLFIPSVETQSILATEHGRVNLVSMASSGEVQLSKNDVVVQGKGGQIELNDTLVEMSGYSGGAVFIRAARFLLDNSIIRSNTFGHIDGKDINLQLTEALYLNGLNSEISVFTVTQNNTGRILIEVPHLEIIGALINTGSGMVGRAGDIEIQAKNIFLKGGALIVSGSQNFGRSGDIRLNIEDTLSVTGFAPGYRINHGFEFENYSSSIFSISMGSGHGGHIFIDTKKLHVEPGFIITDNLGTGQGGNLTINAQQANLLNGGIISSSTNAKGQAGYVDLNVAKIYIAGYTEHSQSAIGTQWNYDPSAIRSVAFGEASGGTVNIQANHITVANNGEITANAWNEGNAGDIFVQANHLHVVDNGQITTSANSSVGGEINLNINELLYLNNGIVTTSVHAGIGNGGSITVAGPQFTVLNQGQIIAQADVGQGGNIRIVAEHFIKSYESLISASSKLGIDGEVKVDLPNDNVTEGLLTLPTTPIDNVSSFSKNPCEVHSLEEYTNRSSFDIHPIAGSPTSPFDLQPSRLSFQSTKIAPTNSQKQSQKIMSPHPRQMALMTVWQPSWFQP